MWSSLSVSELSPSCRIVGRLLESASSAQSVLLMGADGTDKYPRAEELVRGWLGASPDQDLSRVVDLLRVNPAGLSRIIKISQIVNAERDKSDDELGPSIQTFVQTLPLKFKSKVVWIDEPERMNPRAANSLLKMLEEPPNHVRFVLTTASPSGLLATILSRCIMIACRASDTSSLSALEQLFSEGDERRLAHIRAHQSGYEKFLSGVQGLPKLGPASALKVSEDIRSWSEGLGLENARSNHAEGLRCLGLWLRQQGQHEACTHVVESHRRILGNGAAATQLDSLFCRIMPLIAK